MDRSRIKQMKFSKYKKRKGTSNHGKEYEYLTCAYLALISCSDSNILDFHMTTNDHRYGDFDDVGLTVEYADKTSQTFLVQLKHLDSNNRRLTDEMLARDKDDFSLAKYVRSFQNLENRENVICILSTTIKTQIQNDSKFSMVFGEITSKQCQPSNSKCLLLDTTNTKNSSFYFKLEQTQGCADDDASKFFQCFYLLTEQSNYLKIRLQIDQMLDELFGCRIDEFISFMHHWWEGNFELTKHDVIVKLAELALTPFIQELPETVDKSLLKRSKPLKNAIEKFEMTLVKEDCKNIVGQMWTGTTVADDEIKEASLKYGLSKVRTGRLASREYSRVLWFLTKIPLIVKYEEKEDKRIRGAIRLLEQEPDKMGIIMLTKKTKDEFPGWRTFENLHDLQNEKTCYTAIIENFKISLQGRPSISLEQLIDSNMEIAKSIKTEQLFQMLEKELCIGKSLQKLPEPYIRRNISTLFLNIGEVLDYYKSAKNILLIVNYNNQFAINLRNTETKDLDEFLLDLQFGINSKRKLVILAKGNKCTAFHFKEICDKCKMEDIYLLKIIDYNCSTLVLAKGDTFFFQKMRRDAIKIKEDQLYSVFNNPLNIVTGQPGLGKSTLLIYLGQQCPPDCWCVLVKLIEHSSFLSTNPSTEDILKTFLRSEDYFFKKIQTELQQNEKLYLLLDGLDEIRSDAVETVLDFIEDIYPTGIKVWITSRENIKETIIQRLKIFVIDIEEVTEEEQKAYIHKRLRSDYIEEKIKRVINVMFQSISISNNVKNILSVPLLLYVITEMFLNDKQIYEKLSKSEDIFVLTKMYNFFFKGKEKHQKEKAGVKNKEAFNDCFDYILELFEIPALRTCLNSDTFNKIQLENSREFKKCEEFLKKIKVEGDKLGIISQVVEEDKTLRAIFSHQSFAEYFTCVWFKNNLNKLQSLKDDFFDEKYENLRLIFDIMLAEDSPLHLATIYKSPEQVEKYIKHSNEKDKGGRSALHLICSYGTKYEWYYRHRLLKRDSTTYIQIFGMLSTNCDLSEPDSLFNWNYSDYAFNCKCLYPLEKHCLKFEDIFKYFDKTELASLCAYRGYSNILKALIEKYHSLIDLETSDYSRESVLEIAVKGCLDTDRVDLKQMSIETIKVLTRYSAVSTNNIDSALDIALKSDKADTNFIETLLHKKDDVNMESTYGTTPPLLLACANPNTSILKLFIHKGASVNFKSKEGYTPLQMSCEKGIYDNVITLLEKGADINAVAKFNRTILHCASVSSNVDMIKLFLQRKLNLNAIDQDGHTPLHLACKYGTLDAVKTLVENGANIHLVSNKKDTVLHCASKNVLLKQGTITFLIDLGIKIEDINDEELTALQEACSITNSIAIDELIENGANVNVTTRSKQTLIHLLMKYDPNIENVARNAIKLLVEKGVDINAEDERGYTALHQSVFNKNYIFIKTLMEYDHLNVNALTKRNENVLHVLVDISRRFASKREGLKIIKLLTANGIDANQKNQNGDTVVQLALKNFMFSLDLENGEIIQFLISRLVNLDDQNEVLTLLLLTINLSLKKYILLYHQTRNSPNLLKNFPNIIFGYGDLIKFLLKKIKNISNIEELNADDEEFPLNFAVHLAKRNSRFQSELLSQMDRYIEEYPNCCSSDYHADDHLTSYIINKLCLSSSSTTDSVPPQATQHS